MGTFDDFWDEFLAKFSRAPVWLPGTDMHLGEIGKIDRRGYLRVAKLSDFGVGFESEPSSAQTEYFVASEKASAQDVEAKAGAAVPAAAAQVEAGMQMNFEAAHAFVVRVAGVEGTKITNVRAVEDEILRRHAVKPFWEKDWIYIQEVVTAQPCIMVVSEGKQATVSVKAIGSGSGIVGFAQLFTAGAGLSLMQATAGTQQIVTRDRAPFMWRGRWLRGAIKKKWQDRGPKEEEAAAEADELYEDFDDASLFALEPEE